MKSVAFQTQARAVDHLGREQIADCPTAISELWKNAYDAYARNVELHIFDGEEPIAAVFDDGHGMNADEFVNRWLVVGTHSKVSAQSTPAKDRHGIKERPTQGQKGIGRLSSANLGPLLLLVSKRSGDKFVAALVDWRIFENPYLLLADVHVPVAEFEHLDQLNNELPSLKQALLSNLTGSTDDASRTKRILGAWKDYEAVLKKQADNPRDVASPVEEIEATLKSTTFTDRHLRNWAVFKKDSDHGTALIISGINYDLRVHLEGGPKGATAKEAKNRLIETLSNFADPYFDPAKPEITAVDPQFRYAVWAWKSELSRFVVGTNKEFSRRQTDRMEHVLDGYIDESGVFHGQIKAFGKWMKKGREYRIPPPEDFVLPSRKDTTVGPVDLYVATFEQLRSNTTHTDKDFADFNELAAHFAGFMVFRDGLRVMPYGREDNDFLEIEKRRSISAGREFWNARRMFGRVAISRRNNPNLKDKAGREGFIDNLAAKSFRVLVENVLRTAAYDYLGQASDLRKKALPEIQDENRRKKAKEQRAAIAKRQLNNFKKELRSGLEQLPTLLLTAQQVLESVSSSPTADLADLQKNLAELRERYSELVISEVPKNISAFEDDYETYLQGLNETREALDQLALILQDRLKQETPKDPARFLKTHSDDLIRRLDAQIEQWKERIRLLQASEYQRLKDLADGRRKILPTKFDPLIERVRHQRLSLVEARDFIDTEYQLARTENEELFRSYLGALEVLQESIDLEALATFGAEEINELRDEVDRLNSLAQLGITVEILSHELQAYDDMIGHGLRSLPSGVSESSAVEEIKIGYLGLSEQLRFLSPLKLSGERDQRWLSGEEIFAYVDQFFRITLVREKIDLIATKQFKAFRVFDEPSRIYAVFMNLINNAIYWLSVSETKSPKIQIDVKNDYVVVADNGPGVKQSDIDKIFSLFFTKKLRGGRGVGLYLCKANLRSGGHDIFYAEKENHKVLEGANFCISFSGGEFQ